VKLLGIDPGIHGGLAIVDADDGVGVLVDVIDIPTIGTGARERVDVVAIRDWILRHQPAFALVERAQAMPRQGASSGFKYGRATGALETVVALCAVPIEIVEPSVWKRAFRLPGKDKEAARQRALELFPAAPRSRRGGADSAARPHEVPQPHQLGAAKNSGNSRDAGMIRRTVNRRQEHG
jgi:crossover junction endodeoxyribonuclease RuvC